MQGPVAPLLAFALALAAAAAGCVADDPAPAALDAAGTEGAESDCVFSKVDRSGAWTAGLRAHVPPAQSAEVGAGMSATKLRLCAPMNESPIQVGIRGTGTASLLVVEESGAREPIGTVSEPGGTLLLPKLPAGEHWLVFEPAPYVLRMDWTVSLVAPVE